MDKRIFLLLIVLVAISVEAKKKILKKKLNQLKGDYIYYLEMKKILDNLRNEIMNAHD